MICSKMWLSRITSVEICEQKRRPPPQTHTEESNKYPIRMKSLLFLSVSVCTRMGVSAGPCARKHMCSAARGERFLSLGLHGKCLFIVYVCVLSILMCVVCHGRDFCWSLCAHLLSRAYSQRVLFKSEMKVEKNAFYNLVWGAGQ